MKIPEEGLIKRITFRSIGAEILAQLNLEKGLGFTIKGLILTPKTSIEEYLFYDRSRMVRPMALVLLVVTVTTFISLWYFPADQEVSSSLSQSGVLESLIPAIEAFTYISRQYYNLLLMSALPAMSLGTYLVFRTSGLNYAEHLIINMYVFSIQTLLTLPILPIIKVLPWLGIIATMLPAIYYLYALKSIFQTSLGEILWKAIVIFLIIQFIQSLLLVLVIFIFWAWT